MRVQREGMRFIILIATTALAAGILFLGLTVAGLAGLTDSSAEASTTSESSAGVAPSKAKKQRVQGLTLKYHDLGLGSPVTVQLVKDPKKGNVSSATVVGNGTFTVQTKSGEKDLGAKIELQLNGSTKIAIHVSCSKPIDIGFFYADNDKKGVAEAKSAAAFNPAGFNAALEIVSLDPVGVCGSTSTAPTEAALAAAPTEVPSRPAIIDNAAPPARLVIEAIGVDAPMITLGLDSGAIPQVPSTGAEVGWYNYSGKPGSGSNVVISGHVTWDKRAAVFWQLGELQEGELIRLTTERGDQLVYQVTANLLVDPSDPESVRLIYPTDTEMLTLVTCGGTFNRDANARFGGQYTHRTVIQAKPIS